VDLPGLIQSVDKKEDERDIHLVEGLVKEYLQSDKTVILQCFQSDEDIEVRSIWLHCSSSKHRVLLSVVAQ